MHLVVAITPHGFGHAAQVAPVINVLRARVPSLQVTLLTCLPKAFLDERIEGDYRLIDRAADFGLIMNSSLEIDLEASAAAYAEEHLDWERRVEQEAQVLVSLGPDLVLADVPYLTLAAAHQAGLACIALCSLNWADIYRSYFAGRRESRRVLEQMQAAYRCADTFLCPEPSMPMSFLEKRQAIGVIAGKGRKRRDELADRLRISDGEALVLVAPGGVETRFAMERWPQDRGIHWLVSQRWGVEHPDASPLEALGWTFTDLLASCDAVLGKCGYGTVAECVVNGTPLLYIPRPDWPEEATLRSWLEVHQAAVEVPPARLLNGEFNELVGRARTLPVQVCAADGALQAARILERYLVVRSGGFGDA